MDSDSDLDLLIPVPANLIHGYARNRPSSCKPPGQLLINDNYLRPWCMLGLRAWLLSDS